jgi:hypothetical protein
MRSVDEQRLPAGASASARGLPLRPCEHTGPELRSCGKILTPRVAVHLPCDERLLEAKAEGSTPQGMPA